MKMFSGIMLALGAVALLTFGVHGTVVAEEVGPHKGPVAEWGEEEYHVEIVADAKAGTVTAYIYGDHKSFDKGIAKPIATASLVLTIKAEKSVTIKLEPKPAEGDPKGSSSVFVGKHDIFTKGGKLAGTVSGKVGTKAYSGDFKQK